MATSRGPDPDRSYRAGQAPDAQDDFDGQRDAAGGFPHLERRVPPGFGDRAHGAATDALGVFLELLEGVFDAAGEFGAAYQDFVAGCRHLERAEAELVEAVGVRERVEAEVVAFKAEVREWHERPRIGRVDPNRVHPGWTPTFPDGLGVMPDEAAADPVAVTNTPGEADAAAGTDTDLKEI